MRVPQFERFSGWFAGFGLFLAGMVAGSALYMSIHQHNFSILAIQNALLKTRLEEAENNIASLTKKRSLNAYVAMVKVSLWENGTDPLDELSADELKQKVKRDLQVAVGKPVASVKAAPDVFIRLVDGKVYHGIRDKDYLVRVRTIFVAQGELTVWIAAEEYE